jgi:hypothetical protein
MTQRPIIELLLLIAREPGFDFRRGKEIYFSPQRLHRLKYPVIAGVKWPELVASYQLPLSASSI